VPAATVAVPTAAATPIVQAGAGATPGTAAVARPFGELPAASTAIAVIEATNPDQDPGLLSPMEIQFELADPIATPDVLRTVVDAIRTSTGVVAVKSDGVHLLVQYDDSRVQPGQLRQRLTALGHAAAPGTDLPAPGRAAD
jgi:hypothetical protein